MKKIYTFLYILFFFIFMLRCVYVLDPDFGWHMRMGQLILHSGVPKTDPFSYSMPSFHPIDHEWGSDVMIAFLYPLIGFTGISCVFAALASASFALLTYRQTMDERKYALSFLLLALVSSLLFVGIRPQVLSWTFFSCVLVVMEKKKFLWLLPILFLLWANMHGGFVLGLVVLSIFTFFSGKKQMIFWTVCSIGATLINPYFISLWKETWITFSDRGLHQYIIEWQSSLFLFDALICWVSVGISLPLVYLFWRHTNVSSIIVYCLLLFLMVSSVRNIPLYSLFLMYLIPSLISSFANSNPPAIAHSLKRVNTYATLLCLVVCVVQVSTLLWSQKDYTQKSYPIHEVDYLHSHPFVGNIFSLYDWGGYLIWKLPEKKQFIDGRMAIWHNAHPLSGETAYAFGDYENILHGGSIQPIIEKYHITRLLISHRPSASSRPIPSWVRPWMGQTPSKTTLYDQIQSLGFHPIFTGPVGTVYAR